MDNKALIIKLNTFSKVSQTFHCVSTLLLDGFEVDYLTSPEFLLIAKSNPQVFNAHSIDSNLGLKHLLLNCKRLAKNDYTHIYDAENNFYSRLITKLIKHYSKHSIELIRKPLYVKESLKLKLFGKSDFPVPFQSSLQHLQNILPWLKEEIPLTEEHLILPGIDVPFSHFICIAPSSSKDLKRWPVENWVRLIELLGAENFVLLGGPYDEFCQLIEGHFHSRVLNLAGRLTWLESCSYLVKSKLVIGCNTGLLHMADFLGTPSLFLMGPSALGFPSRETSRVIRTQLDCQPCSIDGENQCKNSTYKKCLLDIDANQVLYGVRQIIGRS